MGRTATFDRADAVRAARGVFWDRGYEATSIPDLEHATELRRSSLYHTFGSKKELFDLVIENYLNTIVRPLLARITAQDAAPTALQTYFETITNALETTPEHPGCLLIAAANAPIGQDPAVREAITKYHGELEQAFTHGIGATFPHLTMQEAKNQAKILVALVVSALALARTNRDLAIANLTVAKNLATATAQ